MQRVRSQRVVRQATTDPSFAPTREMDTILLAAILGLLVIGTIAIYSASAVHALRKYGDSLFFLKRQSMWLFLGAGAMWLGATRHYLWLKRWTYPILFAALSMLIAVLVVGTELNGARRWFSLGPLSFQPVEVAKLALISYLAYNLSKKQSRVAYFLQGFVPNMLVAVVFMGLLLMQPDLGSAAILGGTCIVLLFIAGARAHFILLAILAAAPVAYQMIVGTQWRMRRFLAYFNPEAYINDVGYQLAQSKIAIGSGGFSGSGLGQGKQQLGYMVEGHNDFIMACIGEELGFIGFFLVILAFGVIVWRGVTAAMNARESYGSYLAFGITAMFALQAFVNMGVVTGLLPNKGITLPFVSYGGSSLVSAMFLGGVLLSISRCDPLPSSKKKIANRVGRNRRPKAIIVP